MALDRVSAAKELAVELISSQRLKRAARASMCWVLFDSALSAEM